MTYLLAITATGFVKQQVTRFAAKKSSVKAPSGQPLSPYSFSSLDEVLALTGIVPTKKGKSIIYTRPADNATFPQKSLALKFKKSNW